ncbi:MAG: hypothetical protein WC849_03675 [Candidatus Paceibacterota bacterium]
MKSEIKNCQNCKKDFTIEPDDFSFYEKMKVPPPTFCPECRLIRRLVVRNERALYKRKCDLCGEEKILIYPANSRYKVYCYNCFNSDKWDRETYAKEYDFSRPFFEQFKELLESVPRLGMIKQGFNVDSEYSNRVSDLKNCYLIFASNDNENCYYGVSYWSSKDSMDCYNARKCQRCFECIDCYNCNGLKYSKECNSCIDSFFLVNCRNCQNCFDCTNLRSKNYCIRNVQYSKEEYQQKISELNVSNKDELEKIKEEIKQKNLEYINPNLVEYHSINISGNWIENSKNIHSAFNCDNVEDGKYLFGIMNAKDVMDYTYWGLSCELIYESCNIGRQSSSVLFSSESWDQLINAEYCMNCRSSSNLFGCVGLVKKEYCIFNKQYEKVEYEKMIPKIKEHMMNMIFTDKVGRIIKYGEFFPCDLTFFAYNETIAQEYFPKTKEEAIKEGYRWVNSGKKNYIPTIMGNNLPKIIEEVKDDILNETIGCIHKGECNQQCTVAFKIIPDELQFYRANNIPLPELCPNCRHYERLEERNPIKLWKRTCMCDKVTHEHTGKCPNEFETSYSLERSEIVYCEKCYQQEVY